MLICEHGRWYEQSGLLAVGCGFECRADGDFGLSEANVAANQAIHRLFTFHIGLHRFGGGELVGGVFVDERRLEFVLKIGVGGEGVAFLLLAGGIEPDEIAGYVLELRLGLFLHPVPCAGAELVDFRGHTVLAAVFCEFVEGVDRDEDYVVVGIYEFYHFLRAAVDVGTQQSGEFSHAVVDVDYEIAWFNGT